jgi:hypothetical protein
MRATYDDGDAEEELLREEVDRRTSLIVLWPDMVDVRWLFNARLGLWTFEAEVKDAALDGCL